MSRLDINTPDQAQMVVDQLYHDMERRIIASGPGLCPIDMSLNFLNLCHAQTCGKCVPCRIGLGQLSNLMRGILRGKGKMEDLEVMERTAQIIESTASCAIGKASATTTSNTSRTIAASATWNSQCHAWRSAQPASIFLATSR